MTNLYGNYFIQNLINNSNFKQINLIYTYIQKDYVHIAKDYSGTHVLQKLLDYNKNLLDNNNSNNHIKILEKIILASIIDKEIEMAFHTNATHVLQKIILTIPEQNRQYLNEKIYSNLIDLCLDSNGICLVKKIISSTKHILNKKRIINIISTRCIEISQNPYGNYAIQFLIEEWGIHLCYEIVNKIIENISNLSMQKYSSNVSEKIIELIDENNIDYVYQKLFDENILLNVLKNKYGRFVLQKAVKIMNKGKKEEIKKNLLKINLNSNKEKNRLKSFLGCF